MREAGNGRATCCGELSRPGREVEKENVSWRTPCCATDGKVSTFVVPGAVATAPVAINSAGEITGPYFDDTCAPGGCCGTCGFVRAPDGTITIVVSNADPGTSVTVVGIDSAGEVAGSYGKHGFLWTPVSACPGDCSGTGSVAITDLITLVNIALGAAPASVCAQGVPNGVDVDITMIVQAVGNALNGCGG